MTARMTVDGIDLRYRTTGEGPDVVLLHGIARSLEDWDEQHALLSARFRVTSVDLPGFGESGPPAAPNTMESMARAVLGVMTALGVERAHVVGNSLGGAVAMQVATLAPERVRSLVLAASAGFGRTVAPAIRLLAIRPLGRWLLSRPTTKAIYNAERGLYVSRELVTPERLDRGMRFARRAHGGDVMLTTLGGLGNLWGVRARWRRDLLARMVELDIPTFVLWGQKDLILPVAHVEAVATALPNARLHVFPDTGHLPQVERAEEFARLVQQFWAETTDDAGGEHPALPADVPDEERMTDR
ncbi:alpha/beta hydrolase [Tersicoccus solisilvae]|uniref:Alpha/beta hydrolase n=1 Tax=Tersicoccus solisilvae TaxID=1882339 RepID=A0ABQ1NPT3_9MICC|nr:alpha/beta fold hydrolase [Tersicoccus solisilvae]GGC82319.1 alpha/beta hydrolase [Tersicoccus solisilvae]